MSVVSAQQLMDAADVRKINIVPVYMNFEGRFIHGPSLRQLDKYRPKPPGLREVLFAWNERGPCIRTPDSSWSYQIDCALPVFHGPFGEDGRIQGLLETLGIPTTGFSAVNSALAMRKDATKSLAKAEGVAVLPHVIIHRKDIKQSQSVVQRVEAELDYPVVVKPAQLGSSIGVGLAKDQDELIIHLQVALREDTFALVEPQVKNLEELNVAVMYRNGEVKFSAIEKPKTSAELLDFKQKYLSSSGSGQQPGQGKLGNAVVPSQGMLSLTRTINPDLQPELTSQLHEFSRKVFSALGLRGAPRLDFMYNTETGELWFNEINPIPGSYGFFLWEAADDPILFSTLIEMLVEEAIMDSVKQFEDPVPQDAHLLPR